MRSRSSGMEAPDSGRLQVKQPSKSYQKDKDEGNSIEDMIRKSPTIVEKEKEEKVEDGPVHVTDKRMQNASGETCTKKAELMHLSKDELLRLLSIMEGEVQAREDIIHMLQSEKTRPESLEAQYGSAVPVTPLQALQRDRMLTHKRTREEDVYEVPMMELDHLEEKHRETYRRMLEQLLLAEKFHRRTVTELECEKRKHVDFMNKSDDFTNLLEHERERRNLICFSCLHTSSS